MNGQTLDFVIGTVLLIAFVPAFVLYAYCLIDVHKRKTKYPSDKAVWLNVILLAPPVLGCIIYLLDRKKNLKGNK